MMYRLKTGVVVIAFAYCVTPMVVRATVHNDEAYYDNLRLQHQESQHGHEHDQPIVSPPALIPPIEPGMLSAGPFFNIQVNVDENGNNIPGDAGNEPSIAVDPFNTDRVAIGWRQFDTINNNFRQAGWAYTDDGGNSFTFPGKLTPGLFRSDPVLAADADGTFYYYSLQGNFCCDFFKSSDSGKTWGEPLSAFGGDKQWFGIDRTDGIGRGNLYTTWNQRFGCDGDRGMDFTRSTDGGQSFSNPIALPGRPFWGTFSIGHDGAMYISSGDMDVVKSTNAQDPDQTPTFSIVGQANIGGNLISNTGPNPGGLLGQVGIATDHSDGPSRGHVYVLSSVDPPGNDPLDVMISRSVDGGVNWDAPVRVNDDIQQSGAWQWMGTMSVAPSGRIDVVWNDTRNSLNTRLSEQFYSFSIDGGKTWVENIQTTPMFDSFVGWPQQNKMGDYYDMESDALGAHLAYAATFNGEQDVYYMRIAVDCNNNNIHDGDDIKSGFSRDDDGNLTPDECQIPCRGREAIANAKCKQRGGLNRMTVKLKRGLPGDAYDIELTSGEIRSGVLNDKGKVKEQYFGLPAGSGTVMAKWGCGASVDKDYDCP